VVGTLQASVQLKESTQKASGNPIYRPHLGLAYIAARQFDPARQFLRQALQTDSHISSATNVRAAIDQMPARVR